MTTLLTLTLDELKQQRRAAAKILDFDEISRLNKLIFDSESNAVPNKNVIARRSAMAERAAAKISEILTEQQRVSLTLVEIGVRSIDESLTDLFPNEMTESQRNLFDDGWWRLSNGRLRNRFNGMTRDHQYHPVRNEVDGPWELIVRETNDTIFVHFEPTSLPRIVSQLTVKSGQAARSDMIRLAACFDGKKMCSHSAVVRIPREFKRDAIAILKKHIVPEQPIVPEQQVVKPVEVKIKEVKVKEVVDRQYQIRIDQAAAGRYVCVVPDDAASTTDIQCRCNTCGHEWESKVNALLRGTGCKICMRMSRSIPESEAISSVQKICLDKGWKFGGFADGWIGTNKSRLKLTCSNGHEWSPTYLSIVSNGTGCRECYRMK